MEKIGNIDAKTGYLVDSAPYKYYTLINSTCKLWATAQTTNLAGCCQKEQEETSRQLIGQLIYLDKDPDSLVEIHVRRICKNYKEHANICFVARNRMTEASAFGLLHLLHHLRDAGIRNVYMSYATYGNAESTWQMDIDLNPSIQSLLSSLKSPDGRAGIFLCEYLDIVLDVNDRRLPTLLSLLYWCGTLMALSLRGEDQVAEVLRLVEREAGTGRLAHRLQINTYFEASYHIIDLVIEHFRHSTVRLKNEPSVIFSRLNIEDWPTSCPKEEGMRQSAGPTFPYYSFIFTNRPSGRKFRVLISCCDATGNEIIRGVELDFR